MPPHSLLASFRSFPSFQIPPSSKLLLSVQLWTQAMSEPITLTLHRFRGYCTLGRRKILLDLLSARYCTVCEPVRSPIRTHTICPIHHSRGCRRSVLPMHERAARSDQSHEGRQQVGTRGPHCGPVFDCDDICCNRPLRAICILHRWPRISWCLRLDSWTFRIRVASQVHCNFDCFKLCGSGEPMASRWSLGGFRLDMATQGSMFNLGRFCSCIVATLYTATTGLLPSLS